MELFGELFLTASLALFLSFLVAKLVAAAMVTGDSDSKSAPAMDSDEAFVEAVRCQGSEAEMNVEFVNEVVEKVDHFPEELAEEDSGERSEIIDDIPGGGSAESEANDGVSSEPDEEARVLGGGEQEVRSEASEVGSRRGVGDEDDDWEGIEMDELAGDFAAAVKFVESRAAWGGDLPASLVEGGDLQTELYGLRKVATEGACRDPMLPEGLDLSDRVKCDGGQWLRCARHAWQRLGNMTRDVAMEHYIALLSENVPGWMEHHFAGEKKRLEGKTTRSVSPAFSTNERELIGESGAESVDFAGPAESEIKATGQQLLSSS